MPIVLQVSLGRSSVSGVSNAILFVLFALSGVSGLIYQVVWVRWFGNVFGNTVYDGGQSDFIFVYDAVSQQLYNFKFSCG